MKGATATAVALSLWAAVATSATACVPPPGWPFKAKLDLAKTAQTLVQMATFVDIVVAESATADFEVGTSAEANAQARANATDEKLTPQQMSARLREDWDDGAKIHYRVIDRLKGSGSETFSLNGAILPASPPHMKKSMNPVANLRFRLGSRDLSEWEGFGACITPLSTTLGERYLVFRDPDGRLLKQTVAVKFKGKTVFAGGPVYARIYGPDDAWLGAARQALRTFPGR